MSTRCQIGFYDKKEDKLQDFQSLIYRHSDGYPEGVLPDITPFLKWWKNERGLSDSEYASARLLQYLCNRYDGHNADYWKEIDKKPNDDLTGTLGHGICKNFHWDIEYFYKIYPNELQVYKVVTNYDNKSPELDFEKWKVEKTIKL